MYSTYVQTDQMVGYMYRVCGWMAGALGLTAATSYVIYTTPALFEAIFSNAPAVFGLFFLQLGLVIALSAMLDRLSFVAAVGIFIAYSVTMGVTLSSIFAIYEIGSIYMTFGVCSATFGVMGLYGYYTQDDLSGMGSILRMGLFGILIAMVGNMFFKSAPIDYAISLIGVGIFTLLTAYDMQKIRHMGQQLVSQGQMTNKIALLGALILYLDFLNLFLFLLRIMGQQKRK